MKKKEKLKNFFRQELKHGILYLILSTIGGIVDSIVFLTLTKIGLPIILSNIISDIGGMITSFTLNVRKNFKQSDRIKFRTISYFTISLIGTTLSTGLVYFFIKFAKFDEAIAKIFQILIMAIPLYIANRSITFKKYQKSSINKIKNYDSFKH